ncbi:transglycosylase SLT domain-containing protein [Methylocystis sp. 9N]|uniref:Transglycosylase SLT domain-containing protein n=1 Tax=Methylocystis borbori TaxID=3118750 RepID=A0ABU7XE32_9HYPH
MTVTLTNAPPPSKGRAASPRSRRRFRLSLQAILPGFLLERSCSLLLRALGVATALSVLTLLFLSAQKDDSPRFERFMRASRARLALSPLTSLSQPGEDDTALDSDFSLDQAALTWSHRMNDGLDDPSVIRFGSVKVHESIVEHVVKAAQTTEMDPALLMAIADKESNFSTTAKARTSSASGLFQFVEKTWLTAMKSFGWRHGHGESAAALAGEDAAPRVTAEKRAKILNLRNDPYLSAVLAAEMLKKDSAKIAEKIGRPLTPGETYLIHFLGPDDAARFMKTLQEAPESSAVALLPRPARANKPIFYDQQGRKLRDRSVRQVHEAFETMMDKRTSRYEDVATKLPTGATAYAE